jgi:hypothetical protein
MKQLKARIKTWIIQLESGEIKSKQLKILNYIKNNPTTDYTKPKTDIRTMCEKLGIVHQSLTSCISLLEDGGLVKVVGQIEKRSKYYSIYEFVYDQDERDKLMYSRHNEKFHAWLKLADNYSDLIPEDLLEEIIILKNEKLKNQLSLL